MKNPYISLHNLKQKTQSSLATTTGLETQHIIIIYQGWIQPERLERAISAVFGGQVS